MLSAIRLRLIRAVYLGMVCSFGLRALAAPPIAEDYEYRCGELRLKGLMIRPTETTGPRPALLVFPEWWGLNDYATSRARQLAELGYIAVAADMYGDRKVTTDPQVAARLAGALKSDRLEMRRRAQAAIERVRTDPRVDPNKVAAIGYCFGGTVVLELARAGAPLRGVVSFHGGLDRAADLPTTSPIRTRILVLHGADDPLVPPDQVAAFEEEMRTHRADYRIVRYPGAVHSFTNPAAGTDPTRGVAYNPQADRDSWREMAAFLAEVFQMPLPKGHY